MNISEKSCSLREVLDIIGGKWSMPIIYILSKGRLRFSEIERSVEGINTRMLVKELKNMEANGIVTRDVYATVPPTVEYALTVKGQKLLPSIVSLHKWGQEFTVWAFVIIKNDFFWRTGYGVSLFSSIRGNRMIKGMCHPFP